MLWATWRQTCLAMESRPLLLYAAALYVGHAFGNRVELRGLEPLTFWLQTIFLAYFYVARCRLARLLPGKIVADCRWTSPRVWHRWLFVWLF